MPSSANKGSGATIITRTNANTEILFIDLSLDFQLEESLCFVDCTLFFVLCFCAGN